jgi:hypothetical protein
MPTATDQHLPFVTALFWCLGLLLFWSPPLGNVVNDWVATWHVLGYQDGVYRRALTGTLLRVVSPVSEAEIAAFMTMAYLAYAIVASALAQSVWHRPDGQLGLVLLVFGPTGAAFLAQQLGRQDVLILLAAAGVLWASVRHRPFLIAAASGAGVLAHEAFSVLVLPTVLASIARVSPAPRRDAACAVLPACLVSLALYLLPAPDVATLTRVFSVQAEFAPNPIALVEMTGSLSDTAVRTARYTTCGAALGPAGAGLVLAPLLGAGYALLRTSVPWWGIAATLTPLLLLPVVTDWGRRLHFVVTNVGVLVVMSTLTGPGRSTRLSRLAVVYGLCLTVFFIGSLNVRSGIAIRGWNTAVDWICVDTP